MVGKESSHGLTGPLRAGKGGGVGRGGQQTRRCNGLCHAARCLLLVVVVVVVVAVVVAGSVNRTMELDWAVTKETRTRRK